MPSEITIFIKNVSGVSIVFYDVETKSTILFLFSLIIYDKMSLFLSKTLKCLKEYCRIQQIKKEIANEQRIELERIDLYWHNKLLKNEFTLHDFWHSKIE